MPILTFTGSQHRLLLPDEIKERATPWIQRQATNAYRTADQAPFRRMIDFWFMAIAWAVRHEAQPVEKATGGLFVNLGPNPNDVRNFDEWRADLLVILAVRDFGSDSPDVANARKVIDLANRYAEAGAPLLLERLERSMDLSLPRLYQIADLLAGLVTEGTETRSGRTF
ncbi:hypothetical protein [Streptomyces sp. NPDC056464]|uniref:hypothetical protein n=1 Tax=Streptomyces sp. NPDC056464 TaxID=3345828 RepID=UPI0036CC0D9F